MNKADFLERLATALKSLPPSEIKKSLAYYSEIIDDRIEEGMSEEEAVSGLGSIEEISREVMLDATPLPELIRTRVIPNGPASMSDVVLLILGSPLFILLSALIFVFYMCVWLVIITLFLTQFSFGLTGVAAIIASVVDFSSNISIRLLMVCSGLVCLGIGIFTYSPIKKGSKKIIRLTTWFLRNIKLLFIQKEVA